jgi:hypothetical protein
MLLATFLELNLIEIDRKISYDFNVIHYIGLIMMK